MIIDFLSENDFITLTDDFVTELIDINSENEEYEESDELYHYNFNM